MSVSSTAKVYALISGSWTELLHVLPCGFEWGLPDNEPETRIGKIGQLTIPLNNSTGLYTPGGPSMLSGWRLGLMFKLDVTYGTIVKTKFVGFIDDIELPSKTKDLKVYITVLDWMDYASKYPIVNVQLFEDTTIDIAASSLLSGMPVQPLDVNLDSCDYIFPTLLDTVQDRTKFYNELSKLVKSELGMAYLRHSGSNGEDLRIESLTHRNGTAQLTTIPANETDSGYLLAEDGTFLLAEDGTFIVQDVAQTVTFGADKIIYKDIKHGKNRKNRFTVNAYPKRVDTQSQVVYRTEKPIRLSPGESKTFRIFWRDAVSKRPINAVPPEGNGKDVALCHFDTENFVGGGLSSGTGVGGHFVDDTGIDLIDNDAPYIDFSKFGNGSLYLDGTLAWAEYPASSRFDFGSGDFWIEAWDYRLDVTAGEATLSRDGTVAVPPFLFGLSNGTNYTMNLSSNGVSFDIANGISMGTIDADTWVHLAAGRKDGILYTYKNFTLVSAVYAPGTIQAAPTKKLALGRNNTSYLAGNMDELRIKKGECPYTASFTAQTEPYTLSPGTYYEMNSAEDFSGTTMTDYATVSAVYGTEGATYTITNTSPLTVGWLELTTYAYGIYSDSPVETTVEDSDSIDSYGYQNINLQQPYQQETYLGWQEAKKVIDLEHEPRTVLNEIGMFANTNDSLMRSFLYHDVGDLVYIYLPDDGIDGYFYIQGVNGDTRGNNIFYKWKVKQAWTYAKGLSYVTCEFAGGAATDTINYGHVPIVSAENVTRRAFSAWIWLDAITNANEQFIMSTFHDQGGVVFFVDNSATQVLLSFFSSRFDSANGRWTCPADCFAVGGWVHVFAFYDSTSASNDPIIYVDGALQTLTENSAPSGNPTYENGLPFTIGNTRGGTACFNGKIKDVRVYNMDRTTLSVAELAIGLYNDGATGDNYYDGMVFNPFVVRSEDEASYEDLTLTDETLLDGYLGYVGIPSGSPIVRLIP